MICVALLNPAISVFCRCCQIRFDIFGCIQAFRTVEPICPEEAELPMHELLITLIRKHGIAWQVLSPNIFKQVHEDSKYDY